MLLEVFPLQYHVRKNFQHSFHKSFDKFVVSLASQSWMTIAHVVRVVEKLLAIGADIERNGQRLRRWNSRTRCIQSQLPYGNSHTTGALVTEAKDALIISDDDQLDCVVAAVPQQVGNSGEIIWRDPQVPVVGAKCG